MLIASIESKRSPSYGGKVMSCGQFMRYHIVFCEDKMFNGNSTLEEFFAELQKFVVNRFQRLFILFFCSRSN